MDGTIQVTDPAGASLEGIPTPAPPPSTVAVPPNPIDVRIHMQRPSTTPARTFHVEAIQFATSSEITIPSDVISTRIGGVTYDLTP
jgi:hypothetical protein